MQISDPTRQDATEEHVSVYGRGDNVRKKKSKAVEIKRREKSLRG